MDRLGEMELGLNALGPYEIFLFESLLLYA